MKHCVFIILLYFIPTYSIGSEPVFISEINQSFSLEDTASVKAYYHAISSILIKDGFEVEANERLYFKKGIDASDSLQFHKYYCLFSLNNPSTSLDLSDSIYLQKTIDLLSGEVQLKNQHFYLAKAHDELATLYINSAQYTKAFKAIKKAEIYANDSYYLMSRVTAKKALIYLHTNNLYNAVKYYKKAAGTLKSEYAIKSEWTRENIESYDLPDISFFDLSINDGLSYSLMALGHKKMAFKYAAKADSAQVKISAILQQNNSTLNKRLQSQYNQRLLLHYTNLYRIKKAYPDLWMPYDEILSKANELHLSNDYIKSKLQVLMLQVAIGNMDIKKARELFEQVAPRIGFEDEHLFVDYYELIGDYPKALEYKKTQAKNIIERLVINQQNQIAFAETEFQTKEKDKEISALQSQTKQQQLLNNLLILGALTLLVLVCFLGNILQLRNKHKKQLEEEMEKQKTIIFQKEELAKSNALSVRLFNNISHEFRTPLTIINNTLEQINNIPFIEPLTKISVKRAMTQSEELNRIFEQILQLSKLEAGGLKLTLHKLQFADLIGYLQNTFEELSKQKDLRINIDIADIHHIEMTTDVEKLITVFKNLFSNALKHTNPGGLITIKGQVKNSLLHISVEDTGKGIAAKDLERIFDRYYQVEKEATTPSGGFGLGLAICKEYIQLLHGTIKAESELGKGSRFRIKLPLYMSGSASDSFYQFPNYSSFNPNKETEGLPKEGFILLVEDNLEMCAYLKAVLSAEHPLVIVHNGREALKIIERRLPMLIITDLMMPVMDGMKMTKRIKENEEWSNIPILMLTAKNDVLEELKATRIGVDDYLMKPFKEDTLRTHIYRLLKLEEKRYQAPSKNKITNTQEFESKLHTSMDSTLLESDRAWLQEVEEKIAPHINDYELNVERMAELLSISTTHVNRKIKEVTGMTPKKYVTELRLLSARKMLETGTYDSVKSVAYSVGFRSDKSFSRNFKSRFEKYPSECLRR